jgi:hypothetical protein
MIQNWGQIFLKNGRMIQTKSALNMALKYLLNSFVISDISLKPYIGSSCNYTGR